MTSKLLEVCIGILKSNKHAEKHLKPNVNENTKPELKDGGVEILYQYNRNYEQLRKSIKQYHSMRVYRENHPVGAVVAKFATTASGKET